MRNLHIELQRSVSTSSFNDRMNAKIHILWCCHLNNENTGIIDKLERIYCTDIHKAVKATLLYILGCMHRVLTHFEKAEEMLNSACQVFSELGNNIKVDICKSELGRICRATGDFSKAIELQEVLYHSALRRGDIANLGISCSLLGFTYQYYKPNNMSSPDLNTSVQYLGVGLQLSMEVGAKDSAVWCLNNIAKAYIKGNHFQEALQLCKKKLAIAKEMGNATGEGTAYVNAGITCRGLGEYNQAAEYHKSYLKIVGERQLDKAWMEHELALDYLLLNDHESALNYAIQELCTNSTIQSHYNTTWASDKNKVANFKKNHARCFNLLQYILVQMGKPEAALVYANTGRALSISELFSSRYNLASDHYSRIINHAKHCDTLFMMQVIHNYHAIINRLHAVLVLYSLVSPPIDNEREEDLFLYTWVILPETSDIHFVQHHLNKSDMSLFSVMCGREHHYFQEMSHAANSLSALCQDDIDRRLRDIVLCDNSGASEDTCSNAHHFPCSTGMNSDLEKLYALLVHPFVHLLLACYKRIIFVPHRSLTTVPYPALKSIDGCSLVSRFAISISLSINLLEKTVEIMHDHSKQKDSAKNVLIVGNPVMPNPSLSQLSGSEQEAVLVAETLAESSQVVLLCGTAATKSAVIHHIERSSVIHLATHAFEEEPSGQRSSVANVPYDDFSTIGAIVLAKMLISLEVQSMTIPAELVVLSCCKTAQGRVTHQGTLGLSRAFISAGSGAVLVTLWSIPDLHTVELMKTFYASYATSHDAASAMQHAMLHMHKELHLDFGYWGAFSLIGITPGYLTYTCS